MGSEPFEPEEADEVINEISFDENGIISQDGNDVLFDFSWVYTGPSLNLVYPRI